MACLSRARLARFVAGEGDAAETEHVDSCESCRRDVADGIKATRATQLGRYLVIDQLGAGGMGVVYRAFDPELGRNVAVKVLHASHVGDAEAARARLAREARALAALSHPNVVTIHDLGTANDEVFIAMELVAGATLRQWLAAAPRTPAQILEVVLQAGRGLAAAHAAGLVHRDFKPENVLVRADGRAQVSDFGLARSDEDHEPYAASATANTTGAVLTRSGAVLGTLPYMAPEQLAGELADARSDQFSFATVLVEALTGERPFRAGSLAERRATFERGDPPAGLGKLPSRLRSIVRRALAIDPVQRWPAIEPLIAALVPRRSKRWIAGAIVAAAAVSGGVVYVATRPHGASCERAGSRLSGVWNPARAAAIDAAFAASHRPFAGDAARSARAQLDAYARDWTTAVIGACEDTHVRGAQSEALLDLRIACLDQRLAALDALAGVFELGTAATVENAAKAAQQLPQLAACADREALAQTVPPPADPVTRGRVIALRTRLAEATALRAAGDVARATAIATSLAPEATALGYPPVAAEALLLRGVVEADRVQAAAETTLAQAADLAEAGRADVTKAEAWLQLVRAATGQAHYAAAHAHAQHAGAVLARLGPGHEVLAARLANYEGSTFMEEGDYAHALALQQQALALREKLYAGDGPEVATALNSLGNVEYNLSHDAKAVAAQTRALEIRTRVLGPHHPDVGASHSNLAAALSSLGKLDEALAHDQEARRIAEEVFGTHSKQAMQAIGNIAAAYKFMGRYADAVATAQQALVVAEETVGPEHPLTATLHYVIGQSYLELGDPVHARPEIERCLAIRLAVQKPDHPEVLTARSLLGRLELQTGHAKAARQIFEVVLERQRATLGPDHSDLAASHGLIANAARELGDYRAELAHFTAALANDEKNLGLEHGDLVLDLTGIGNAHLDLRDPGAAIAPLERAVALCRKLSDVEPGARADALFALARARGRAGRALAIEARDAFAALGKAKEVDHKAAIAWLAAH